MGRAALVMTQEEYDQRFEEIRHDLSMEIYSEGVGLLELKTCLKGKITQLNALGKLVITTKDSLVKNCVSRGCFSHLHDAIVTKYINKPIHSITIEDFSKIPLKELDNFWEIKDNHIRAMKEMVKSVGLKFRD